MGVLGARESDLGGRIWKRWNRNAYAMRWDGARKKLVPMEKAAADEMLKSILEKAQAGKTTVINHLDTTQDIYTETSTDN